MIDRLLLAAGACALASSFAFADDGFKDAKLGVELRPTAGWKIAKAKDDSFGALAEATFEGDAYLVASLTREEAHPDKTLAKVADDDEAIAKDGAKSFAREKDEKLDRKPGEWHWRTYKYETEHGTKMSCGLVVAKLDKELFLLKFNSGDELSKHDKAVKDLIASLRIGGNASTSGPEGHPPKGDLPRGDAPSGDAPKETAKEASKPAEGSAGGSYENPWAKWGVGSWVELKIVTVAQGTETEMTQRQTLAEKGGDELTIKVEGKMTKPAAMDMPPSEMKVPAKGKGGAAGAGSAPKELGKGEETLEVGGKKIACKWVEHEVDAGGQKMTSKVWSSDEVPGGVVKVDTKGENLTSSMTVVGFEAKK